MNIKEWYPENHSQMPKSQVYKWNRSAYFIHRGENQGHEIESKFSKVFPVYTKARIRGYGSSQHAPPLWYNSIAQQTPKTVAEDVNEADIGSQLLKPQPHGVFRSPESCLPAVFSLGMIFSHVLPRVFKMVANWQPFYTHLMQDTDQEGQAGFILIKGLLLNVFLEDSNLGRLLPSV